MSGILMALVLAFSLPALAAPTFPPLTGRVVDDAKLLSPQVEAQLTAKLQNLEQTTGRQLVVVTLPSLQGYEIEDYGYQLGRAWGIGEKGKNSGVLLIVAPNERKVRIEVGYGLEPILTDALSSVIIQSAVLPKFREGDMEGGVVAGTDALVQQLALPEDQAKARAQQAFTVPAESSGSGGSPFVAVIVLFVVIFIVSRIFRGRRRGGLASALPWIILDGLANSGRGGGGGWGSGGGGGGFSGGGGSFGGGGSSGSW
ncbi:MAG: TPM domain-containing protein [Caulobacter sp.]|nr:TPM domain-containing protein [Caulobacter sp.]